MPQTLRNKKLFKKNWKCLNVLVSCFIFFIITEMEILELGEILVQWMVFLSVNRWTVIRVCVLDDYSPQLVDGAQVCFVV